MAAPPARKKLVVEHKAVWEEGWQEDASLRVDGAVELAVGAAPAKPLVLFRKYGPKVKYVEDSEYTSPAAPLDLLDHWVRVRLEGATLWQGIVKADRRVVKRAASSEQRGEQRLVAYGPLDILRRITIDTAFCIGVAGDIVELGWIPGMNEHRKGHGLQGNSGPEFSARGCNTYGYYEVAEDGSRYGVPWSHLEYLTYILKMHVQRYNGPPTNPASQLVGPEWTVSGDTGYLNDMETLVEWGSSRTADRMVRRLVPASYGLDFAVLPTEAGFTLKVFALSRDGITFGTASLPANEDEVEVNPTTDEHVVACEAETSRLNKVDVLKVIGERIRSCFTLETTDKRNLWTAAQEATYKAGSTKGAPTTADHDLARQDDALRFVWGGFAAPVAWTWHNGLAIPLLDDYGEFSAFNAPAQDEFRSTLPALPIREGADYTTDPPTVPSTPEAYIPPLGVVSISAARGYAPFDKLSNADLETDDSLKVFSGSVRRLGDEWGLILEAVPNHILAKNHWAAGAPAASKIDPETQGVDYDNIVLTLAAETDQRLACRSAATDASDDGSKHVIHVRGALFEYLTVETVVGITSDGFLKRSPAEPDEGKGIILRNDNGALHFAMVGAIERFLSDRFSAAIAVKEMQARMTDLGKVLVMGSDEGDLAGKWAVITAISLDQESGITSIRAGYAR